MLVSLMKGTGHRSVELPTPPKGLVVWRRLDPVFRKGNTKRGIWAIEKNWSFRVWGYPCFVGIISQTMMRVQYSAQKTSKNTFWVGPKLSHWFKKKDLWFSSFHEVFRPSILTQNTLSEGSWSIWNGFVDDKLEHFQDGAVGFTLLITSSVAPGDTEVLLSVVGFLRNNSGNFCGREVPSLKLT